MDLVDPLFLANKEPGFWNGKVGNAGQGLLLLRFLQKEKKKEEKKKKKKKKEKRKKKKEKEETTSKSKSQEVNHMIRGEKISPKLPPLMVLGCNLEEVAEVEQEGGAKQAKKKKRKKKKGTNQSDNKAVVVGVGVTEGEIARVAGVVQRRRRFCVAFVCVCVCLVQKKSCIKSQYFVYVIFLKYFDIMTERTQKNGETEEEGGFYMKMLILGNLSRFTGFHSVMDSKTGKPKSDPRRDLSVVMERIRPVFMSNDVATRR